MLQFILGRASSGKSYEVCRRIAECVKEGKQPVLIIPEQFSFESEKRILKLLGDSDAQKVKVLSFSRLCDEVESVAGGSANEPFSDSDKIIIMTAAMKKAGQELKYFGKYMLSSGFTGMMINTVDEFSMNAVYPEDIRAAAENLGEGVLSRKLFDTAAIYEAYNGILSEKFPDTGNRLSRLYETLCENNYFCGKQVFIDSFGGFTGQQYKIIERILAGAENTVVSFCDNADERGSLGIFANIRKAKRRITRIADDYGVPKAGDCILKSGRYVSDGLAAIEEFMCLGETDGNAGGALGVCCAQTVYDEAQFVARNIRKIVREQGARFNDFVVIARNAADYEQVLSVAFKKNGINCFSDKRLPLSSFPPATAAMAAMDLTGRITTEKVLRFHKCGVGFLSEEELGTLENYAYIWHIEGDGWNKDWDMDPRGLESEGDASDEIKAINDLRVRAMAPITGFSKSFCGNTGNKARAVVQLLESARGSFLSLSNEYKTADNSVLSDGLVTAYSKIMSILNSLAVCLDKDATDKEFKDAFKNCVAIESVGIIPQMIDEVTFGSAERIQPSRPSYVFILGANQGVFPRAPQASGIFGVAEINKLIEWGIDIPDCSVYSAVDEDLLVYNCVCCADKQVFISYNNRAGEPAHFVKKLIQKFQIDVINEPDALSEYNLPETVDAAFSRFCRSIPESVDYETLKAVLEQSGEYSERISAADENKTRPRFNIPRELVLKLTGKRIGLSASKLEKYGKCPFTYFCDYIISVKKPQPVEFNPLQSGTLLHYVLQRFIEETVDRIKTVKQDEAYALAERFTNEYLDSVKGYRRAETPHLKLMVRYMTETLKFICNRLATEFAQSDFKPEKCELYIGRNGDMPPFSIPVDDEVSAELTGKVDRVDSFGGYVRIIDYKSGAKTFSLPDILVGQNMQMLIYLLAICRDKEFGDKPAGVFYYDISLLKEKGTTGKMNGFMPETGELITAMDKEAKGEFIGQKLSKIDENSPSDEDFTAIFEFVEKKLKETAKSIAAGEFGANPVKTTRNGACDYCEYSAICRIENEQPPAVEKITPAEALEEIKRQVNAGEI